MILKNIHKSYGDNKVLNNISMDIETGKSTVIFGPNGCGKSTLMNIICGLENADSGTIENRPKKIGYVFQDYKRTLLPWYSVKDNILYPLTVKNVSKAKAEKRLGSILAYIPINFSLSQKVCDLSGGQAQMVSLLRALIIEPDLLILDEPFTALDYNNSLMFMKKIVDIQKMMGMTMLSICHDLDQAIFLGDTAITLSHRPTSIINVQDMSALNKDCLSIIGSANFAAEKATLLKHIDGVMVD